MSDLIMALMENLKSTEMSIDSKLVAIIAIGDLLMTAGESCAALMSDVMSVIKSAADMSL